MPKKPWRYSVKSKPILWGWVIQPGVCLSVSSCRNAKLLKSNKKTKVRRTFKEMILRIGAPYTLTPLSGGLVIWSRLTGPVWDSMP